MSWKPTSEVWLETEERLAIDYILTDDDKSAIKNLVMDYNLVQNNHTDNIIKAVKKNSEVESLLTLLNQMENKKNAFKQELLSTKTSNVTL